MDEKRQLLRHFLAALAYRTQKSLRGAPNDFGTFSAGERVRTPAELVRHMTSVLGYARTFFIGGTYWPDPLPFLRDEIERLHQVLGDLAHLIDSDAPMLGDITAEKFLQGPLADAMTHAGQIAMLRRLAGSPVPPENFIYADVDSSRLGPDQAQPARPDGIWGEAPDGWTGPTRAGA